MQPILWIQYPFWMAGTNFDRFDDAGSWPRRRQGADPPGHVENQSASPLCVCARGFDLVKTYKDDPQ